MIVCICAGVDEAELQGLESLEEAAEKTGAGTVCGACAECLKTIIEAAQAAGPG